MGKSLFVLVRAFRRAKGFLWRNVLTKPSAAVLRAAHRLDLGEKPTFVGYPIIKGNGKVAIGKGCKLISSHLGNPIGLFRPCIIEAIKEDSKVTIGDNFSASGVCIVAENNVTIGNNVSIGANATIVDTDFHSTSIAERTQSSSSSKTAPVVIGDDVWIGMNAVILKGVTIYEGAVVGANAVVTSDIPPHTIAAGNPARLIRRIN